MASKKNNASVSKPIEPTAKPNQVMQAGTKYSLYLKLALLLGSVSFLVYANTLSNGFVLDDHIVIKDNFLVAKGVSGIPEILSTPYHFGWSSTNTDNLYRPLSLVMFAIEYQLFGLNPFPNHLVNILLFVACVILLFRFLIELFGQSKTEIAFIAALFFALHPIHTEVVANIKSRDELFCFFFSFISLHVFYKYAQSGKMAKLIFGAVYFLLALMSKETVITYLLLVPVIYFFYNNANKKRSLQISLAVLFAAGLFLLARFASLNFHYATISKIDMIENALANPQLSLASRLATAVLILGHYLRLLVVPWPLVSDYSLGSIPYAQFTDILVLLSLAIYLFLGVFSIYRLVKYPKDPYAFGVLFFIISISLFTNIPFLLGTTMAERFLFFGSVGYCIVVAFLLSSIFNKAGFPLLKQPTVVAILAFIGIVFAFITIQRNGEWSDNLTLYRADLSKLPNNSRLNYYVGDELLSILSTQAGHEDQALKNESITRLTKAISLYPNYANAHLDLGIVYGANGVLDSAEVHWLRSLQLNPLQLSLCYKLAALYFNRKQFDSSIVYNKKAIDLNPAYAVTYVNVGFCFKNLGKYDSALVYTHRAILLDPTFNGAYEVLSSTWKNLGNADSANKYLNIARIKNPGFNPQ